MTELMRIAALFAATALAEIVGCYLPWLVLKEGRPVWLLVPAALSLALFAWLLTLHPSAAGHLPRTAACISRWRWSGCGWSTVSR